MAVRPVVYDDSTKKHRPLGSGEKMDGLSASSIISSQSGNLITTGSDGLAYATGSGIADPSADNLLEATPSGKLKMDADRLAEWLDGHPDDAKAISEAIKVVSGDSGNLIAKGTDRGAYLSASALASALAGMSAAQLQQLAAALADGRTIVASNGKLTVDPTGATAAQLDKISSAIRKSGGGLSVGSDGKLSVDFASMDPAIMRAVVLSMVQDGGGIGVDSNGQLYVDFDSMPTDKFEAMMKSLKMLVPLSSAMYVYVDGGSDGDSLVDGRGTQEKPFKTIQAAVNYVTGTYALGNYNVYIRVRPGTYSSASVLNLPSYSRATGMLHLEADDAENRPVIANASSLQSTLGVNGGHWRLRNINIRNIVTDNGSSIPAYPNGLIVNSGATAYLHSVQVYLSYADAAPATHTIYARGVSIASGGTLHVVPSASGPSGIEVHKGNATSALLLVVGTDGNFWLDSSNIANEGDVYKFFLSGEVGSAINVEGGRFGWAGGELYKIEMAIPSGSSLTGTYPYTLRNGGTMYMKSTSPVPGTYTNDPIVESATYSWYAINPNI